MDYVAKHGDFSEYDRKFNVIDVSKTVQSVGKSNQQTEQATCLNETDSHPKEAPSVEDVEGARGFLWHP